jgi:hypothetical protein
VGVATANGPYATPEELRALADLAEHINQSWHDWEIGEHTLSFDNVDVYGENGVRIGVLRWRPEADSFAVTIGD